MMDPLIEPNMRHPFVAQSELRAYRAGFLRCLDLFGIWSDGERYIGSQQTNVKEITKCIEDELAEILRGRE